MTPEEMRKVIDQYFIDGDDSYECYVKTCGFYKGEEKELLCSISSYYNFIEPGYHDAPDSVSFEFYVHPIEHLDKCPSISREAICYCGEFSMVLEITDITKRNDVYEAAKKKVDRWLAGLDLEDDDGQFMKPSEKTLNFLYALVAYYYGVMQKKLKKEQDQ